MREEQRKIPDVDIETFVQTLQKHGIDISAPDIIQMFMESDDYYSVNDGNTIRIYKRDTDELLMWKPVR